MKKKRKNWHCKLHQIAADLEEEEKRNPKADPKRREFKSGRTCSDPARF